MMLNKLLASRLFGVKSVPIEQLKQTNLKSGWYLVRGVSTHADESIHFCIESSDAEKNTHCYAPATLTNQRLRKYIWTNGGTLVVGDSTVLTSLERFPAWQVRARSALRAFRNASGCAIKSAITTVLLAHEDLVQKQSELTPKRDLFAGLENVKSQQKLSIRLWPISKLSELGRCRTGRQDEYIIFTDNDVFLHRNTADALACSLGKKRPKAVYTHHFDSMGNCFIKPEPDELYLCQYDYIGPAVFWRSDIIHEIFPDTQRASAADIYVCCLRLISKEEDVNRADVMPVQSDRKPVKNTKSTVSEKFGLRVEPSDNTIATWQYPELERCPLISIIIPTYNGLALLRACVESIKNKTSYSKYEIIVVDNNSDDPATINYLNEIEADGVSVIKYPFPFNYSAINNFAAAKARGDYYCFLNNDTEVIKPDWLSIMLHWSREPSVGAVGAKLLYTDGRIQHAGVVVGMGNAAGHLHRFEYDKPDTLQHRLICTQQVSAVTAACMLVQAEKFNEVKGFDEQKLAVAYNDIDLCLKLRVKGYTNIFCPDAVLYHHESVSRGDDLASDKIKRYMAELRTFQKRWRTKQFNDRVMSKLWDSHSERAPKLTTKRRFANDKY